MIIDRERRVLELQLELNKLERLQTMPLHQVVAEHPHFGKKRRPAEGAKVPLGQVAQLR